MIWTSIYTTPFGLTEPLFVPKYWNPPSLFNLAQTTGFDIESLIFCFGIGGVASVLYNVFTSSRLGEITLIERHNSRHNFHKVVLVTPFLVFAILYFFDWNPIYPGIIAMFAGGIATLFCRPDLIRKTWLGGLIFLVYYLLLLSGLEISSPGYIENVWNLSALSGWTIWELPFEEFLFAFGFGFYWSGVYEHYNWKLIVSH